MKKIKIKYIVILIIFTFFTIIAFKVGIDANNNIKKLGKENVTPYQIGQEIGRSFRNTFVK